MNQQDQKDAICQLIDSSEEHAIGALLKIYSFQTASEQDCKTTAVQNSLGFNSQDAYILSDMAQFYLRKGYLSEKQISFVRRSIKKYVGQLMAGFEPVKKNGIKIAAPEILASKTVTLSGNELIIKFNFPKGDNQFGDTVSKVKSLAGRKFDPVRKCWTILLSLESILKLQKWEFKMDDKLTEWFAKMTSQPEVTADIQIPGLKKQLYPFQKVGVSFIESRNGRALLGDEMGLGKTIQALAWLQLHPGKRPVIIVCPASLKLNWRREIHTGITEDKIHIISGKKPYSLACYENFVFIINYDILSDWVEDLKKINPQVVVFDEVHYTKNPAANRTKAALALAKKAKHIINLSGTPIINRPIEFYTSIKMVEPTLFASRWAYAHKYCGAKHNGFGWDFSGATNTKELHEILSKSIMLRRLKADVLKDLPAKVRSVVPIELENRTEYQSATADIISWIRQNEGREKAEKAKSAEVLVQFEKLKQLAVKGKMKAAISWIQDFLESGQKLVIFATHTNTLNELQDEFGKIAVRLDGSTSQADRQNVVDKFQNNESIRLFLGNIKAAGVGITLTAASNTCFMELGWTPGEHDQAEDRVHRIGQEADSVNAYYLIADGTIENEIAALLDEKRQVLSAVLDGKDVEETSILSVLINKMKEE